MLLNKLFIILIIICVLPTSYAIAKEKRHHDKYFDAVLDACSKGKYSLVLDNIYDLKDKSRHADELIIELLDYYIGEGPSEVIEEIITKKGNEMLKLLVSKRKKPLQCIEKYKSVCLDKFKDGLEI